MDLSVVIVNYNVQYFLEQTLLSVRKAAQQLSTEVFVVDNNSVDGSVEMVRQKFPEVTLIANKDNPGFSIANNQAIRQSKGKYVLLLNPDTVVEEDTFIKCFHFMEQHPDAGGLGVRMIDGAGVFLPESKRGFPSPWVAFSKTFGLARFFPKSKLFNAYHLGYLDEHETHAIDVLAGAFMFMRKETLDKVGLLDEQFFMYGEDIDLSYRIIKGGYQNYYYPDTTIIHYKGESTKKGSLNYVKAFYQAMIIFARKHFTGSKAKVFVLMLQGAIYLRATLTLLANWTQRLALPLIEATAIYSGLLMLKSFWANYHFHDPNYYPLEVSCINFPLYVLIWLSSVFFTGGYDEPFQLRRLLRGLVSGTLILAAIYGFLDIEYRSSRALILLGAAWAFGITIFIRMLWFFVKYKSLNIGGQQSKRLIFVGTKSETQRARQLLLDAEVSINILGRVGVADQKEEDTLGELAQLEEIVRIYKVEEIIFCSRDMSAQAIMQWMTKLGAQLLYKILPEDSLSIIGSHSKNMSGELYTIDIQFNIAKALHKRNKRIFDILFSLFLALTFPLQLLLVKQPFTLIKNIIQVFLGQKTWVAYQATDKVDVLPKLRKGILSPVAVFQSDHLDQTTIQRLNMLYAKDYEWFADLEICWKAWRHLGDS